MKNILLFGIRLIISNPGTKFMALFLALFVWFYINQEYTEKTEPIDVPLKLELPPQIIGRAQDINNNPVATVRIILEGPRGVIKEKPLDIVCTHKIAVNTTIEDLVYQKEEITKSDFNLPDSIKVRNITPSEIQVQLMKEKEKYLQLETAVKGEPAKGYRVAGVRTEPSEILVLGPKHIMGKISAIPCQPVDISGATDSFSRPGSIVETINSIPIYTNDSFKIIVSIVEEQEEIMLKDVEVKILQPSNFPYLVSTNPKQMDLKLKVAKGEKIEKGQVDLFVNVGKLYSDPKNIKPGNFPGVPVELNIPSGITLAEPIKPVTLEIAELPREAPPSPSPPGH